jgi:MFS family permease
VLALGAVSFLTDISTEMLAGLMPAFVAGLGAGASFLGLLEGGADTVASLLKLFSGKLADRAAHKKPLVLAGYGLSSLSRSLTGLAMAPWHLLAIRVADRIGKGIRTSPRDALLAGAVPASERGRAFGFHRAADHAGAAVGPLLAALLLWLGLSVRGVFWVASIPAALSVLALWAWVREERPASTEGKEPQAAPRSAPTPFPRGFRRFLLASGLFALGNSPDLLLLLHAKELGLDVVYLPLLWAAFQWVKSALAAPLGALSDRVGRRAMILAGWAVYALSYLLFSLAASPLSVAAIFLLYGAYYGFTDGAAAALVADLAPSSQRGRAFGWFHAVTGLCALPAGLLAGFLWDHYSPAHALLCGAGFALLASLVLLTQPRAAS